MSCTVVFLATPGRIPVVAFIGDDGDEDANDNNDQESCSSGKAIDLLRDMTEEGVITPGQGQQMVKRLLNGKITVPVIALMKSGKSTLLNALMHGTYLPASATPETAAIVTIKHLRDRTTPVLHYEEHELKSSINHKVVCKEGLSYRQTAHFHDIIPCAESEMASYCSDVNGELIGYGGPEEGQWLHVKGMGFLPVFVPKQGRALFPLEPLWVPRPSQIEGDKTAIRHTIAEINTARRNDKLALPALGELTLNIHVPVLSSPQPEHGLGNNFDGCGDVEIIDSPGANEHGAGLQHEVKMIMHRADAIVYVLDYTKLNSDDEASMFKLLQNVCDSIVSSASASSKVPRMHFVLNKVDLHSKRNDKPMDIIIANVAKMLSELLGVEIKPPQIIPIAAENALLAREVESAIDIHDRPFVEDFLMKSRGQCFEDNLDEQEYESAALSDADSLLIKSNIESLEYRVLHQVARKKHLILLETIFERLSSHLSLLLERKRAEEWSLRSEQSALNAAIQRLRMMLHEVPDRLKILHGICDESTKEIEFSTHGHFDEMRKHAKDTINSMFEEKQSLPSTLPHT